MVGCSISWPYRECHRVYKIMPFSHVSICWGCYAGAAMFGLLCLGIELPVKRVPNYRKIFPHKVNQHKSNPLQGPEFHVSVEQSHHFVDRLARG